ncbi:hypothetical protein CLV47_12312 [Antricoccus suffuscus]|uniref:Uncharacterized protein n=1 Tax=Antricoccus suffuscus TaxID=1629062 RepID=A0A2T0ZEJ7_9ACTN|nr:hypothetical protein CLV47_12312 [Antricoccus suffuscus]
MPLVGDSVAVTVRDTFDEPMVAYPAQVIGSLPAAQSVGLVPPQWIKILA